MCNSKISLLIIAVLLTTATFARADGVFDGTRYSLGGEMSLLNSTTYTSANTHDVNNFKASPSDSKLAIRKNRPGFTIFAQARFNDYIAVEAGYSIILKVTATVQNNNQATNKVTTPYLDLLGFMPVAPRADLIGEVGVGLLKSKANVSNAIFYNLDSLNKAKVGFRAGAGAMFYLTNNWTTRVMLRYQQGNKAFLTSNTSLAIGLQYTF